MSKRGSSNSVKYNLSNTVVPKQSGTLSPAAAAVAGEFAHYVRDSSSCSSRPRSSTSSRCHCCNAEGQEGAPTYPKKLTLVDEFKSWTDSPEVSSGEFTDVNCVPEDDENDDDDELDVGVERSPSWTLPALQPPRRPSSLYYAKPPVVAPQDVAPQPAAPQKVAPLSKRHNEDAVPTDTARPSPNAHNTLLTSSADKIHSPTAATKSVKFVWLFNFVSRLFRPFGKRKENQQEVPTTAGQTVRESKPKPPAVYALPKVRNPADFSIGRVKKKEEHRPIRIRKRRRRRRLSDFALRNVFVDTETQTQFRRLLVSFRHRLCRRNKEPKLAAPRAVDPQMSTVSTDSGRSVNKDSASVRSESVDRKSKAIAKLWKRAARSAFSNKHLISSSPTLEEGHIDPTPADKDCRYAKSRESNCARSGNDSPSSCDLPSNYRLRNRALSLASLKSSGSPKALNGDDLEALNNCWASWAGADTLGKKDGEEDCRPITICTASCRYEVVRRVSKKLGMRDVAEDEPWNLYWTDLSISPERCKEMKRFQKINHFPGMAEICRKDLLARNLNRMYRLFPKDYNFFPKTWCLPADLGDLCAYSRTRRNKTYILKPDTGCQGKGIYLTKNVRDLKPHTRMICQAYISKPFLVDGYKFDMRVYTLVTSCDPLRVFVYKDGLVRFCTIPYHEPSSQNTNNVFMHLTNYAVNKHSRMYVVDDEAGSKRKISTLNKWLENKNYNVTEIWQRVDELIVKTLIAALPVLRHNYHACFPSHDFTFACFELLGFDILLDHKLKPFILEVNHSPSFHTDAQIDKDVKEGLLHDTFGILNLSQYDKKKIMEEDRKRVRDRLLQNIHKDRCTTSASKEALSKAGALKRHRRNTAVSSSESSLNHAGKHPQESALNLGRTPSDCSINMAEHNPWKIQFDWEDNNLGNYRRVYPLPDGEPDKYEIFFHQNLSSLFQETAASRAREEASKQQRDLYESLVTELGVHKINEVKQKEEEARRLSSSGLLANSKRRDYERVRPESPVGHPRKVRPLVLRVKRNVASTLKKHQGNSKVLNCSFVPTAISESEETSRNAALAKRTLLLQSQGIVKLVNDLLKQNKTGDLRKYAALDVPEPTAQRNSTEKGSSSICLDGTSLFTTQYPKLPSLLSLIQKTAGQHNTEANNRKTVESAFGLEVSCTKTMFRVGPNW